MFDVFLCMQAFIHAHPHVFVLIQACVYLFLNRIKAFEKNIMNLAAKTHWNKFNSETSLCFVHYRKQDLILGLSELPDLLLTSGLTLRRVYRKNYCPGLLLHISSIMRFPVSSEDRCHPLQHFKLTQGIQMFSFAVANMSRMKSLIQMCSTLPHMLAILHQKARTVNCKYVQQHSSDDPKPRQSMIRFNAWQRQLDLKGSRPLRIS